MSSFDLSSPRPARRRWLGLLCALLIVVALAALGWWSNGGVEARDTFSTFLNQPGGLAKGSPVQLRGLVAGRVRSVELSEREGHLGVVVEFWIAHRYRPWLREGTQVIAIADLVGSTRLDLRPNLATKALLPDGAELPGELAPDAITQFLALQPVVTNLINEVGTLVASLTARGEQIDPLLASLNLQLASFAETQMQMKAVLTESQSLIANAANDERTMTASFTAILDSMNQGLLPQIGRTLDDNNQRLTALFDSLQRTTASVEQKLPRLLQLSEETMQNSRDVSEAAANTWPFNRYLKKKRAAAPATAAPSP